jgi:O-acetyl-ADP-ribose deacetylase (regulator of RNase III)
MNTVLAERILQTGQMLQIVQGDITAEPVDAIVNAANEFLQHGGGLARAIVRRGGETIQKESDDWVRRHGRVSHSLPAWTSAGALPAKYVIHAVGPVWGAGDEESKLAQAVAGALRLADELQSHTVAMPAISTGIFGFPRDRAAEIIPAAIEAYFSGNGSSGIGTVRLVLFDQPTLEAFTSIWNDKQVK